MPCDEYRPGYAADQRADKILLHLRAVMLIMIFNTLLKKGFIRQSSQLQFSLHIGQPATYKRGWKN